jgi:hypothetical protein
MNNNNNLEKFIEDIESIKMTQYEKNEMRQHLSSFAINYQPSNSPYSLAMLYAKYIFAASFIALLSLGSFSQFISYDALPGETLYPIKIGHENLRLATVSNDTQKITYQIKRTEKRIQEATRLAQEEKLDSETQKEIAEVIKLQTKKVKEQIEIVKKENPKSALALNSELKSTIKANSEVLREVTEKRREEISPEIKNNGGDSREASKMKDVHLDVPIIEENITTLDTDTSLDDLIQTIDFLEIPTKKKVSTVTTLLDSLDAEVAEIEIFEDIVEQEIIEKEMLEMSLSKEDEIIELPKEIVTKIKEPTDEQLNVEFIDVSTEPLRVENQNRETSQEIYKMNRQSEVINYEIKALQDILEIKKEISKFKIAAINDIVEDVSETNTELSIFNEEILRSEAESLIKEKKYKQALLKFQKILEFYRQESIEIKAKEDLGINRQELTENESSQKME